MHSIQALTHRLETAISNYLEELEDAVENGNVEETWASYLRAVVRPTIETIKNIKSKLDDLPDTYLRATRNCCVEVVPREIIGMCRAVPEPSQIVKDLLKGSKKSLKKVISQKMRKGKIKTVVVERDRVFIEAVDLLHLILNQPQQTTTKPMEESLGQIDNPEDTVDVEAEEDTGDTEEEEENARGPNVDGDSLAE